MSAWGFEVYPMLPDYAARQESLGRSCASGKCADVPTHVTSYRYVTGRAGRTQTSSRLVCTAHAQRFAAKHDLVIGEAKDLPRTSSQQLIDAFLGQQ